MDHMQFQMPPMGPQTLINPPPQIFGAYTQDGMPVAHLPPELAAQMFPDPASLLDDANEAKRRRIARVRTFRRGALCRRLRSRKGEMG
jgi:hypothetical protein